MEISKRHLVKLVQAYSEACWMLEKNKLDLITSVFLSILNGSSQVNSLEDSEENEFKPDYVVKNGVGILEIEGMLLHKASYLDAMCGMVSTTNLHEIFIKMTKDTNVKEILLYFDSPGGEVTGIFEFQETINNSTKKVVAFTDSMMASAAYVLASGANEIIATPSAIVGSIGVISQIVKEIGSTNYQTYSIYAGKYKAYGSSNTPLKEDELDYFQKKVDRVYEKMVTSIAISRGIDVNSVKENQAEAGQAEFLLELVDKIVPNKFNFLEEKYGIV